MSAQHLVALVLAVLAGACFLLVAFARGDVAGIGLDPLGHLLFVAAVATWMSCRHHHA